LPHAFGVGDEVDRDDLPVADGVAGHTPAVPRRCPDEPAAPSTSACWAGLAPRVAQAATVAAPRVTLGAPMRTAVSSALTLTSGSSSANRASKSPPREAARKASTTSR
jgi:hypothetical protein